MIPVLLDDTPLHDSLLEHQWLDFRPFIYAASSRGKSLGAAIGAIKAQTFVVGLIGVSSLVGAGIGEIVTNLKRRTRNQWGQINGVRL